MLRFLDEDQIREVLRFEDLIPAMEKALIEFSSGKVVQPVRQMLSVEGHRGHFGVMPAIGHAMGVKLVTFYPFNAERGLHTHHAMIVLFRPESGEPLAVMDGRLITEMRTAAVSAAATKALAAPDAKILAILGSGVQARSHVDALCRVREIEQIRVWGRTPENARRFAEEVGGEPMSAEAAVRGADVVVTATSSTEPVLRGAWLKTGAHVNAIGWAGPEGRELDAEAMDNVVVVDSREAVLRECGDVLLAKAEIHAELGEVLAGVKQIEPQATTVFESVGLAVEDIAAAKLAVDALGA